MWKSYGYGAASTTVNQDEEAGYGFLAFGFADDQTEAVQRSKCQACVNNRYTQFFLKTANWTYTILVCLLFMAFAINRAHKMKPQDTWTLGKILLAVVYGASSFIMNFPMALLFTKNAIQSVKRLLFGNPKRLNNKREPLFIISASLAIFLALGTTVAGWAIASDIKDDLKMFRFIQLIPGFTEFLALLSLWNTFSTRLVGSVHLIHSVLLLAWNFINTFSCINRHGQLYRDVLADLKNHGADMEQRPLVEMPQAADSKRFLRSFLLNTFYSKMVADKGRRPGFTWSQTGTWAFKQFMTAAIISLFIVNMQPLWLKLTVDGLESVSFLKWMSNAGGVWYAATSNELFYAQSAIKFLPTLVSFASVTVPKVKNKFYNADSACKKVTVAVGTIGFMAAWFAFAYFSGEGYAQLGAEAVSKGFGPIPDKTYFSIQGLGAFTKSLFPVYDWLITAFAAGVIVNGGSALRYLQDQYTFFKADGERPESTFDSKKAIELLEREGSSVLKGIAYEVHLARKGAKPIPSFWQRCFGCEKDLLDQNLLPLSDREPQTVF